MKKRLDQNPCVKALRRFLAVIMAGAMIFGLCACSEQKPNGTETLTVERESGPPALQTANEATALALRYYIYARLKTEALIQTDYESMLDGAFEEQLDTLVSIWKTADALTSDAEKIIDQAIMLLETTSADQTAADIQPQAQVTTLAATGTNPSAVPLADNGGEVVDRQTWAENLSKQYDALRGAQRYKQLAQQLGTDTKTAVEQMALAQKIIRNAADLEEAQAEKDEYNRCYNTLQVYKTSSKVGLYIGATVATGGGSLAALAGSSMSIGTAGAVLVGGVDCIAEVGATTSSIVLGENHQVTMGFQEASDVLQPVSMVMGLVTLDPSKAEEMIALVGESVMEWFVPGKITGIGIDMTKEGGTRIIAQIVDAAEQNIPGAQEALEKALEALGLSLPSEKGVSLENLLRVYTTNSETALASMQKLVEQIAGQGWETPTADLQTQEIEPIETSPSATTPQDTETSVKEAIYEIRNVSGSPWVIDSSSDPKYFEDLDAIDVSDYTVASGGSVRGGINVEARLASGALIELSPSTNTITILCAAGEVPADEDEQYVYLNPLYGQTAQTYAVTITGVYGEYAIIEWNGSAFTQVGQDVFGTSF